MSKIVDITGNKYGFLTVMSFSHISKRCAFWNCKCDCGGTKIANGNSLKAGDVTSCGCRAKFRDLSGERFGRLTVLNFDHVFNKRRYYWLCRCDCGTEKVIDSAALKSGATVSCGCYNIDKSSTHKMSGSRIYRIHHDMIQRCKNKQIRGYGAKGVKVCNRWSRKNGFLNFLADMGEPPSEFHELDRIDNDGDYCLENCRWVTRKQNARNRGDNALLTYNEETRCKIEWSEVYGISPNLINYRLGKGWSIEKALTTPVDVCNRGVKNG